MRVRQVTSSSAVTNDREILDLIRAHQPVSAGVLLQLMSGLLPDGQPDGQKLARIHNQLRHLVDVGQVRNKGSRRYPLWGLI